MTKKSDYHITGGPGGAAGVDLSEKAADDKPKPKPGDADYDWAQHYPENTPLYVHTFPDGKVVAIKTFAAIYSKTFLYKVRDMPTDIDIEFAALDRAGCPQAKAVFLALDDTDGDPISDLYRAWIAAGTSNGDGDKGLTAGE